MNDGDKVRILTDLVFLIAPDIQAYVAGQIGTVVEWHGGLYVSPPSGDCILVQLADGSYADVHPDSLELINE